jgi:hypothetical protein
MFLRLEIRLERNFVRHFTFCCEFDDWGFSEESRCEENCSDVLRLRGGATSESQSITITISRSIVTLDSPTQKQPQSLIGADRTKPNWMAISKLSSSVRDIKHMDHIRADGLRYHNEEND